MQKFKRSHFVPFILIFAFAYLAGRAWNLAGHSSSHKVLRLPIPATEVADTEIDLADPASTTDPNKLTATKSIPVHSSTAVNASKIIRDSKGAALFRELYNNSSLHASLYTPEGQAALEQRFFAPYSQDYQGEVTSRLGILKSLAHNPQARTPSSAPPDTMIGFYRKVLSNPQENWVVKRQAFKNLKSQLSESELTHYYSSLDSRVVRLSVKSEPELLLEVLNEKVGSR